MSKQKPNAQIRIADGAGGMRPVEDLRFDEDAWPIQIVIPAKDAEAWMVHLLAEIGERGWSSGGLSQLDHAENSGTLHVHLTSGSATPSIAIVWEKQRDAALRIKARPSGSPPPPQEIVRELLNATTTRQRKGKTESAHRLAMLTYDGLPWRGELWLGSQIRLGPPSKYPTDALLGPQIVIVDAMIEGIGWQGINANFQKRLHELRIFLSVVLGLNITTSKCERGWIYEVDENLRTTDCRIGQLGYVEMSATPGFPSSGDAPTIARRNVERPGLGPTGIWPDTTEEWIPNDIEELWRAFSELPAAKRDHFVRAGNAYVIARSMWPEQRTAYAAFLVVACEALKPTGKRYDRANVYDVVASLIAPSESEKLRQMSLSPQGVRSKHLHRGELIGGELLPMLVSNPFQDPSFDEMLSELTKISRTCLIEWLRCKGEYKFLWLQRKKPNLISRIWATVTRFWAWGNR
jgi:hypothetical protein